PRKPTRWARSEGGHLTGAGRRNGLPTRTDSRCTPACTSTPTTGKASLIFAGNGARPPLVQTRLSQLADGRLAYLLKRPLADGTEVLVLEPCELLRKL